MLPKAFKERKQQLDIVGKGRYDLGRLNRPIFLDRFLGFLYLL